MLICWFLYLFVQSDMTELIDKIVHYKLQKDIDGTFYMDKDSSGDVNKKLDRGRIFHFIKDSWLF